MNLTARYEYINNKIKSTISKRTIRNIYKVIRNEIKTYYSISYKSEEFSSIGANEFYGIDESMFTHLKDRTQVWILGIINNVTKNFVIQPTISRDSNTLKKFVKQFIQPGNILVNDCWAGYNFIRVSNNYKDISHNHSNGSFGSGIPYMSNYYERRNATKTASKNIFFL